MSNTISAEEYRRMNRKKEPVSKKERTEPSGKSPLATDEEINNLLKGL